MVKASSCVWGWPPACAGLTIVPPPGPAAFPKDAARDLLYSCSMLNTFLGIFDERICQSQSGSKALVGECAVASNIGQSKQPLKQDGLSAHFFDFSFEKCPQQPPARLNTTSEYRGLDIGTSPRVQLPVFVSTRASPPRRASHFYYSLPSHCYTALLAAPQAIYQQELH